MGQINSEVTTQFDLYFVVPDVIGEGSILFHGVTGEVVALSILNSRLLSADEKTGLAATVLINAPSKAMYELGKLTCDAMLLDPNQKIEILRHMFGAYSGESVCVEIHAPRPIPRGLQIIHESAPNEECPCKPYCIRYTNTNSN